MTFDDNLKNVKKMNIDDLHELVKREFNVGVLSFVQRLAHGTLTVPMLKFLIKHGADVNEKNEQGTNGHTHNHVLWTFYHLFVHFQ